LFCWFFIYVLRLCPCLKMMPWELRDFTRLMNAREFLDPISRGFVLHEKIAHPRSHAAEFPHALDVFQDPDAIIQSNPFLEFGLRFQQGRADIRARTDRTEIAKFYNVAGTKKEGRCTLISFDQQLGEVLGAWIRFGRQDDSAAIYCKYIYSGGLNISVNLWSRESDNIEIGYAHLGGGNLDVDHTDVLLIIGGLDWMN